MKRSVAQFVRNCEPRVPVAKMGVVSDTPRNLDQDPRTVVGSQTGVVRKVAVRYHLQPEWFGTQHGPDFGYRFKVQDLNEIGFGKFQMLAGLFSESPNFRVA